MKGLGKRRGTAGRWGCGRRGKGHHFLGQGLDALCVNEAEEGYTTQKLEELSVFPVLQNSCPHLYAHKNIVPTTKLQLYRKLSQGFLLCFCDDIRLRSHELQELLEIHLKYHEDKETDACLKLICIHSCARDY